MKCKRCKKGKGIHFWNGLVGYVCINCYEHLSKHKGFVDYLRTCRRCDKEYRSHTRQSRICPDCNTQHKPKEISHDN